MLDRLLSVLENFGEALLPLTVIDEYERGALLFLGKFKHTLQPGLHFRWPLLTQVLRDSVVPRTTDLKAQSLITLDRRTVTVRAIATWQIIDVEKALLRADGVDDVVRDTYYAAIGSAVAKTSFDDMLTGSFLTQLKNECQKRADPYGVKVDRIALAELTLSRTLRLITR